MVYINIMVYTIIVYIMVDMSWLWSDCPDISF